MSRNDYTKLPLTATGRGVARGLRAEFAAVPSLSIGFAQDFCGLIDAPQHCAAGSCHSAPELGGGAFVTVFGREW